MFGLEFFIGLGYLGGFLAGFLSSVTIFLPSPTFVFVFFLGKMLNPILLGLVSGFGSALGEMTSYIAGLGAQRLARKKYKKGINRVKKLFSKYRPSVVIFIFSATPLPFDIVGIFCGIIKYDKKKFFIATLIGKILKFTLIALAGYYGLQWIMSYLE